MITAPGAVSLPGMVYVVPDSDPTPVPPALVQVTPVRDHPEGSDDSLIVTAESAVWMV